MKLFVYEMFVCSRDNNNLFQTKLCCTHGETILSTVLSSYENGSHAVDYLEKDTHGISLFTVEGGKKLCFKSLSVLTCFETHREYFYAHIDFVGAIVVDSCRIGEWFSA
jgi:hypothetical protein